MADAALPAEVKDIHVEFAASPAKAQLHALAAELRAHREAILDAWRAYGEVVPGRNIVAYYLGFRTFGHLQSWRGARQALAAAWTLQPSDDLSELCMLVGLPHEARAARVDAIGRRLDLLHLAAFFERASR